MSLRPRRFDLVVFDWDGTLFDSTALLTQCMQQACADLGLPVPSDADAAYVIGMGPAAAIRHAAPSLPPERYHELGRRYGAHYMARQDELVLFPGTLAMLQALKANNHWLAVATGKSRRGLDQALSATELHGVFDSSRTADETRSKPDPTMLLELMREFGVEPERTLMIGDTTHDLQLALNAGTHSIAVSYGAHEPAAFSDYPTRFVAHATSDLHDWLARHA